jgi:serine/threonine protein kinase
VDVYSFGVLLFELVTGIRPFEGQTVNEIFDQVLHQALDLEPLKKGGIPDAVRDLIHGCTAKEPGLRTQDFSIVVGKIDEILRRMPESGRSRRRWVWIAGALVLAAVVLGFYIVLRYY